MIRRLKNNDDWLLLKQEYGVRPYTDYSEDIFGKKVNYNMTQAILTEDEAGEMKKRINNILAVNKITYRI